MTKNQPQTYDNWRADFAGESIATQEYWLPATGNALQISANEYATARLKRHTPIQLYMITGGPPEVMPTTRDPPNAVQLYSNRISKRYSEVKVRATYHVKTLNAKPTMSKKLKERLSSEQVRINASL